MNASGGYLPCMACKLARVMYLESEGSHTTVCVVCHIANDPYSQDKEPDNIMTMDDDNDARAYVLPVALSQTPRTERIACNLNVLIRCGFCILIVMIFLPRSLVWRGRSLYGDDNRQ